MARKSAENKTRPTEVSVDAFLAAVEPPARREDGLALCALLTRLSGEPPVMWGPSIVGFGARRYRHDSGREGDMPRVAFSPRKPASVLYLYGDFPERPALTEALGASTGRGCIYIKRLAAVDMDVLERLVAASLAWLAAN